MNQLKCGSTACGGMLVANDLFCASCGTAAPWPGNATIAGPLPNGSSAGTPGTSVPFFTHEPPRQLGYLSNATRYLCAAAYLNRDFANKAVSNLIASHRAVAPSVNFDVGPVLRHCLQARKNILIRDLLLFSIIVLGLLFVTLPTIDVLLVAFLFGVLLPNMRAKGSRFARGILGIVILVISLFATASFTFFVVLYAAITAFSAEQSLSAALAVTIIVPLVLLAATFSVEFGYIRTTTKTLTEHLRPGASSQQPTSSAAEARIAAVEGAQWGNVTLYATEDPFIGAGVLLDRHWSIAITLDPEKQDGRPPESRWPESTDGRAPAAGGRVSIDPVELHRRIRQSLQELNDPRYPVNERVAGLTVSDRLVGSGSLQWASPLLDQANFMPFSHASQEAIEALIRSPQAGLRYFQHVSVNNEGPAVVSGDRQVLDGVDQGMSISAFVYAAVEGGMFYLEFAITVLPPVLGQYQRMDRRPAMSLRRVFSDTIYSPAGLYHAFQLWRQEQRVVTPANFYDGTLVADLGALVSVRELGMAGELGSYIRERDVSKYQQIIQRLLLRTVRDFLVEKKIDVRDFEGVATVINNGDIQNIDARNGSNQIGGPRSRFTQDRRPQQQRTTRGERL
jgi:hypothetical protein